MKFFVTEQIGPKRSRTPEGFLLCHDVPVGRIGIMDYLESELPGVEGDRGVIRVERSEDEVFALETIASASGKPLVNDHPDEDVTPENWRDLAHGSMMNPHRGEADFADVLLADILVTSKEGIEAIDAGKVEVSLGYDADYEQVKPGFARQHNIRINHVALVEAGRCGPRCSIGDQAISVTLQEANMASKVTVQKPKSFKDRLMAAFKAKDEAAIEKLAGEVTEDSGEDIAENDLTSGKGGNITINVTGGTTPAAAASEAKTGDEEVEAAADPLKEIKDMLTGLGERITKLETAGSASSTADEDGDEDEDDNGESTNDAEGEEEKEGEGDKPKKTGDRKPTRDSRGLASLFQETAARAEILFPGIKVPTFDAKADPIKTRDAMCAFRRKALDKAFGTDEGKAAIEPLLAGKTFDTKKLTCDQATLMFNAASEVMKAANRASAIGSGKIRSSDTGMVKVGSIAEMNKAAGDFWARKS